jgi:hypothetical protein
MAVIAVNARGLNPEPRLEAMVCGVLLQILHEMVARHPSPELPWNPITRKMRQRADGVQVQTVIAAAPRFPHTPTLNDGGVYAPRSQCRSRSQSSGTSTDDDDIVHSLRLRPI